MNTNEPNPNPAADSGQPPTRDEGGTKQAQDAAPGEGKRIEQAETRTDEANTRTEQAEARTHQANTRTNEANARTEQADARTGLANTQTAEANLRTAQAEKRSGALHASELSYRRLFESARDGILILDADTGRVTDANPFLVEMLGFSHGEMVGKTVGELSPFKDAVANLAMLERLQKDGYVRYENLPLETRDGRRIEVEFVSNLYRAGDEMVIQCNIRDITLRTRTEALLRERDDQLRLFVEHSPAASAMLDCDMRYLLVSQRWMQDYRLDKPSIIGRSHYEVFPEIPPRWREIHRRCLAGAVEKGDEDIFRRADGASNLIRWEIRPWHRADGLIGGILIFSEDITKRKQAELDLARQRAELQLIFDAVPALIFYKDREGHFVRVNQALADAVGIPPEAFIGKTDADLGSMHAGAYRADDLRVLNSGTAMRGCEERLHTIGGERWLLTDKIPYRDQTGGIVGIIGLSVDITERKRSEEALRASEAEFRSLAESMPQMVWVTRPDGSNVYFNQQWMTYTGLPREESMGDGWNKPFHPDDRQRAWDAWQRATTKLDKYSLECRLRRADGEYRWWLIRGVPHLDAAGKVLKWFGTCTDIHESKLAEEELLRQAAELRVRNEELTRFNRAAVGRELRMVELKREVNELCGKLGEPARHRIVESNSSAPATTETPP